MSANTQPIRLLGIVLSLVIIGTVIFSFVPMKENAQDSAISISKGHVQYTDNHALIRSQVK